jgi:phospholipase/carboxylesterase
MFDALQQGLPLAQANKALILLHGRGGTAQSMLSLVPQLNLSDAAVFAPQANLQSWYPFGFMASDEGNFISLESSIQKVSLLFDQLVQEGMPAEHIYLLGFSQGACLSLEFAARHAQKLGGVIAFTGGLIGERLNKDKYTGDFKGTPVSISGSVRDSHVPAQRMRESAQLLEDMGAVVHVSFFEDAGHTIRPEELAWVNQKIFS